MHTKSNAIYALVLQMEQNHLTWTDGRPVSLMSWNNAFIKRDNPTQISKRFTYARYHGAGKQTWFYPSISQFLITKASTVLQPGIGDHCGYMMITSVYSVRDWLMGPCHNITNPGAFLCRTDRKERYNQTSQTDIIYNNNSLRLTFACSNGWTLIHGKCFKIDNMSNMQTCHSNGGSIFRDESSVTEWLSHILAFNDFHCKSLTYEFPHDEVKALNNVTLSEKNEQCFVCAADVEAVSSCPHGLFHCDDGTCICPAAACDGKWDCVYGEDESQCDTLMCHIHNIYQNQSFCQTECSIKKHNCLCGLHFWQCEDGGCIEISKYCDYQTDCQDSSDEDKCSHPQCSPTSPVQQRAVCSQSCSI